MPGYENPVKVRGISGKERKKPFSIEKNGIFLEDYLTRVYSLDIMVAL
jgi:hypothetical protein